MSDFPERSIEISCQENERVADFLWQKSHEDSPFFPVKLTAKMGVRRCRTALPSAHGDSDGKFCTRGAGFVQELNAYEKAGVCCDLSISAGMFKLG